MVLGLNKLGRVHNSDLDSIRTVRLHNLINVCQARAWRYLAIEPTQASSLRIHFHSPLRTRLEIPDAYPRQSVRRSQ